MCTQWHNKRAYREHPGASRSLWGSDSPKQLSKQSIPGGPVHSFERVAECNGVLCLSKPSPSMAIGNLDDSGQILIKSKVAYAQRGLCQRWQWGQQALVLPFVLSFPYFLILSAFAFIYWYIDLHNPSYILSISIKYYQLLVLSYTSTHLHISGLSFRSDSEVSCIWRFTHAHAAEFVPMDVHEMGMYKYILTHTHVYVLANCNLGELPTLVQYKHIDMLSCANDWTALFRIFGQVIWHLQLLLLVQYQEAVDGRVSCFIMFYHVLSCFITFYHVLSCCIMFYHVLSCFIMFYHVLSCFIMVYHVLSCLIRGSYNWLVTLWVMYDNAIVSAISARFSCATSNGPDHLPLRSTEFGFRIFEFVEICSDQANHLGIWCNPWCGGPACIRSTEIGKFSHARRGGSEWSRVIRTGKMCIQKWFWMLKKVFRL